MPGAEVVLQPTMWKDRSTPIKNPGGAHPYDHHGIKACWSVPAQTIPRQPARSLELRVRDPGTLGLELETNARRSQVEYCHLRKGEKASVGEAGSR